MYSMLPYEKLDRKGRCGNSATTVLLVDLIFFYRQDEGRTRSNSLSVQFDLEGIEGLGDSRVSHNFSQITHLTDYLNT